MHWHAVDVPILTTLPTPLLLLFRTFDPSQLNLPLTINSRPRCTTTAKSAVFSGLLFAGAFSAGSASDEEKNALSDLMVSLGSTGRMDLERI